MILCDIFNPCI